MSLGELAALLKERNAIDERIARIIQRPMSAGHAGEWIASEIFDIALEPSAVNLAYDGRFRSGPMVGKTVNVKWYLKREGLLDMHVSPTLDYYLVLTGPRATAAHSRGATRPWRIDSVYLFNAHRLLNEQRARGVKIGVATSIRHAQWDESELYPTPRSPEALISSRQAELLRLFS